MSTEDRMPAEERGGNRGEPEHKQVISNRPDDSDAGPGPEGAESDDEVLPFPARANSPDGTRRNPPPSASPNGT
jgi:hypothetical protein